MTNRQTVKALVVILLATIVYYWKILLTHQFSLLTGTEDVYQAYAWLQFFVVSIRQGTFPTWDPYTFAGHSFPGEMQTAAFNPLHLILALVPFNRHGVFSPQLYHLWYVFAHFLGACFMFALVREFGLTRFSGVIAGICFAFGGIVGRAPWLDMVETSIWLPVVFLFLLRAIRAGTVKSALLNASLSGLALGLAILAGRLHMVILQGLVVVSAGAFACFSRDLPQKPSRTRPWAMPALIVAVVALIGACAGAVQLLPSIEYSNHAVRFFTGDQALPATQKIPYAYLHDHVLWPHGILGMLFPFAFNGSLGRGEVINPYLGVFPLMAAVIGILACWRNAWVRYMAGLAAAAFLYALGPFTPVHGLLYALVPRLWMVREASRFMYLVDFALAILCAFGIDALLCARPWESAWNKLNRVLMGLLIVCASALLVPAVLGRPSVNPYVSLSILLVFASYGLVRSMITRGHAGTATRLAILGLVLFDLSSFDWTAANKIETARTRTDELENVMSCRGAARFLKSQAGPFRVAILTDPKPDIGHLFQVPTVSGTGATLATNFLDVMGRQDLLNVRYLLRPASAREPGALYQDRFWKVYENPNAYPAAWVAHEAIVDSSREHLLRQLDRKDLDLHRLALLAEPLETDLQPAVDGARDDARFAAYGPNRLELNVQASSRGLLVLSEMFYPGWQATVNGKPARIYKVDGALRGVVVPGGLSSVKLRYAPLSVFVGGVLTSAAFAGALLCLGLHWRDRRFKRRTAQVVQAMRASAAVGG